MHKYKIHKRFGKAIRGLQPIVCGPPYMPSRSNHTDNWSEVTCLSCLARRESLKREKAKRLATLAARQAKSKRAKDFEMREIRAAKREQAILDEQNRTDR